jgi:hypothetical protein
LNRANRDLRILPITELSAVFSDRRQQCPRFVVLAVLRGMTSSRSDFSSPITCIAPPQQGHDVVSGWFRLTNAGADAAGMTAGATAGSGSGVEWPLCADSCRSLCGHNSAEDNRNGHSNTAIATARHLPWTAIRHLCKAGAGDLDEVWQHDLGDDGIVDSPLFRARLVVIATMLRHD